MPLVDSTRVHGPNAESPNYAVPFDPSCVEQRPCLHPVGSAGLTRTDEGLGLGGGTQRRQSISEVPVNAKCACLSDKSPEVDPSPPQYMAAKSSNSQNKYVNMYMTNIMEEIQCTKKKKHRLYLVLALMVKRISVVW